MYLDPEVEISTTNTICWMVNITVHRIKIMTIIMILLWGDYKIALSYAKVTTPGCYLLSSSHGPPHNSCFPKPNPVRPRLSDFCQILVLVLVSHRHRPPNQHRTSYGSILVSHAIRHGRKPIGILEFSIVGGKGT